MQTNLGPYWGFSSKNHVQTTREFHDLNMIFAVWALLLVDLTIGIKNDFLCINISRGTMHVTDDDVSFCDGPGMLIRKNAKPYINSTWIALLIHGFVPVKTWLLIACDTAFYVPAFFWSVQRTQISLRICSQVRIFTYRMKNGYPQSSKRHIYRLIKETLHTFFDNSSNRSIEIWYLLYSNKWINATVLFVVIVTVVYD